MKNGLRIGYHKLDTKLIHLMRYFGFKMDTIFKVLSFVYSRIPDRWRAILNNHNYVDYSDFNTERKYIEKMRRKKWIYK